jgi:hypothetical protein
MSVMSIVKEVNEVVHRVRVKLYPSHLPAVKGLYIARTSNEKALRVEDVCAALKNRAGFTGDYSTLVENVKAYFDEAAYQLCDGYAVNTGYFSLYPNIGGTFKSLHDTFDREEHPLTFRLRIGSRFRRLAKAVNIAVEGLGSRFGSVSQFIDKSSKAENSIITGGGIFIISGKRIKVAGDNEKCGVYFETVGEGNTRIKVPEDFIENVPTKIIGIVPELLPAKSYRVVVVTQFSGSSNAFLKKPRTIVSDFELTAE